MKETEATALVEEIRQQIPALEPYKRVSDPRAQKYVVVITLPVHATQVELHTRGEWTVYRDHIKKTT